jgi:D-arabinose 1-dehydrogenase-like Zn-dependent alcohol dehydrogenase
LEGLGIDGQLLVVGASPEPLPVNTLGLMQRRASIKGWPSGTCADSEDTMRFAVQTGVRAMIEEFPLDRAADAYAHMLSGAARFRVVLTMAD